MTRVIWQWIKDIVSRKPAVRHTFFSTSTLTLT
jgi:hypothetical protein